MVTVQQALPAPFIRQHFAINEESLAFLDIKSKIRSTYFSCAWTYQLIIFFLVKKTAERTSAQQVSFVSLLH